NSYKKTLDQISLHISAGEHVSIVGRSGSGKSTLVQLITKLYPAKSGAVLLDSQDIMSIDAESIRSQVSLVESESWIFSGSVRENISIGNKGIDFDKIIAASTLTLAHEFIQNLPNKYDTIIGDKGIRLSTGQLQKIALARTILIKPQVLILDEALSALDPESESKVFNNLSNLMGGKTLIYIGSNRRNVNLSDKIFVLDSGKLIESGTHQQLLNNEEMYFHLFCKDES
ncbi:ATP-binding cassette domain-containing protein, partial [bacterium]|nr:ATP-binding cassette domain-containing protein [bacterium]